MRKIENIAELKSERIRLMQNKMNLETEIQSDFQEIKYYFSPSHIIPEGVSKVLINKHHGVVNDSLGLLADVIIRKVLLRNAGFLAKLVLPMLARNFTSNVVSENKDKIITWVAGLFSKSSKKKKSPDKVYEESFEDFYN
jgi:hypothetical protein